MKMTRHNAFYYLAGITAFYLVLISPVWTYFGNLIMGIPVFIISFILWKVGKSKDPNQARYKYIVYMWYAAAAIAAISLVGFLIFN